MSSHKRSYKRSNKDDFTDEEIKKILEKLHEAPSHQKEEEELLKHGFPSKKIPPIVEIFKKADEVKKTKKINKTNKLDSKRKNTFEESDHVKKRFPSQIFEKLQEASSNHVKEIEELLKHGFPIKKIPGMVEIFKKADKKNKGGNMKKTRKNKK